MIKSLPLVEMVYDKGIRSPACAGLGLTGWGRLYIADEQEELSLSVTVISCPSPWLVHLPLCLQKSLHLFETLLVELIMTSAGIVQPKLAQVPGGRVICCPHVRRKALVRVPGAGMVSNCLQQVLEESSRRWSESLVLIYCLLPEYKKFCRCLA